MASETPTLVWLRSRWGEIKSGEAHFSNGRGKKTVGVVFPLESPLILGFPMMGRKSRSEEFNLLTGKRLIWGQGVSEDVDDWTMEEKDRVRILETGGG